ncbi:PHP domain-containing protein [candidate division KSB1 bacterium]|nr:PHP domain-containing protein [candidate division KSB1 bacterium]
MTDNPRILNAFRADLHIHTCLSPCADLEMLPTKIVQKAKLEGLDVIGICDHNSSENVTAIKKIGKRANLTVLGGIEVTSREEVHILALFENDKDLDEFQMMIYENLQGVNDEDLFGSQLVVDEQDTIQSSNERLLIGATELSIDEIVDKVHSLNGIVIASHVDRERFGIIGQLGIIPEGLLLDGLELSSELSPNKEDLTSVNYPVVTFSDAHYLNDIGKNSTTFIVDAIQVDELKKALLGEHGRSFTTHFGHC